MPPVLAVKLLGLARWAWLLIIIVALFVGAFFWFQHAEQTDDALNQEIGATKAVASGQTQTLQQTKDSRDGEQEMRDSDERSSLRFSECLLDSRDRNQCERFRPLAGAE